jgi:hypothetical protein
LQLCALLVVESGTVLRRISARVFVELSGSIVILSITSSPSLARPLSLLDVGQTARPIQSKIRLPCVLEETDSLTMVVKRHRHTTVDVVLATLDQTVTV